MASVQIHARSRRGTVRPLADDQVRVRVPPAAPVDRQRVGQPLGRGQVPGEHPRKGSLAALWQLLRERELHLAIHPPVRSFVPIGRVPVPPGVVLCPRGHVPARDVGDLSTVVRIPFVALGVLPLAGDVVVLRCGRMAARLRSDAHLEMVDGHRRHLPTRSSRGLDARHFRRKCV